MVGLALVVFVSVFAAGLKDSFNGAIADRAKADLVVTSDTVAPLSRAAGRRIARLPGVGATRRSTSTRSRSTAQSQRASPTSSTASTRCAARRLPLPLAARLRRRPAARSSRGAALVEEQFAKAHDITVGERFRVTGPDGPRATLTAIAEYRDPQLMQGVMVDVGDVPRPLVAARPVRAS